MPTSCRSLSAACLIPAAMLVISVPALADETDPPGSLSVSVTAAVVSDYRFRGLSQSAGDPAVQGSLQVNHSSGLYAGAWASSLNFANLGPLPDAVYGNTEVDLYAGWSGGIGSALTADVGLLYYAYPGGHVGKAEFFEPYASISSTLGPATAKLGLAYAPKQAALDFNADGRNDSSTYAYFDLSGGIPTTPVSLAAHVGHASGALSPKFATGASGTYDGGWDYSLGATWAVLPHLSLGVSYVGVDGKSIRDYSNDTVVGSLKLTF